MPKPTLNKLRKHPHAVVLLAFKKGDPDVVADHDFEWFDTPDGVETFVKDVIQWSQEDAKLFGDLYHVIVTIPDTSIDPLTAGNVSAIAPADPAWEQSIGDLIRKDTSVLIPQVVKADVPEGEDPPQKPVKPRKVAKPKKGRAPTKAAAAAKVKVMIPVMEAIDKELAKPAKKAPAKKAAPAKVAADKAAAAVKAPAKRVRRTAKDKEALKAMIAERAAAKAKPAEDKEAVNAFLAVGDKKAN